MKREYTVVDQQIEDGGMMAIVSELPRAVTQGRTMKAARGRKTAHRTHPTPLAPRVERNVGWDANPSHARFRHLNPAYGPCPRMSEDYHHFLGR